MDINMCIELLNECAITPSILLMQINSLTNKQKLQIQIVKIRLICKMSSNKKLELSYVLSLIAEFIKYLAVKIIFSFEQIF